MNSFETMQDAFRVAGQILDGSMDPHLGCGLIGAIGEKLNHALALQEFIHLAHVQTGHEQFGFNEASCLPEILSACQELLALKTPPIVQTDTFGND